MTNEVYEQISALIDDFGVSGILCLLRDWAEGQIETLDDDPVSDHAYRIRALSDFIEDVQTLVAHTDVD